MNDSRIPLINFISKYVDCSNNNGRSYQLNVICEKNRLKLFYYTDLHNQTGLVGKKVYSINIPQYINRNEDTFEVMGLLQGEIGKQLDGKINFCNHEVPLIKKVIDWFEKELDFPKDLWKWYIKVNINEPEDQIYRQKIEQKVIEFWMHALSLNKGQAYPKSVSYIKNTTHKYLKLEDYGTLIIEKKNNPLSQVVKRMVKTIFNNILDYKSTEIRAFMRGIIAAESNVEFNKKDGHFRVFITAVDPDERRLFCKALQRLGIESTFYPKFHAMVVSRKRNNIELQRQGLMMLSPEKSEKFGRMLASYNSERL